MYVTQFSCVCAYFIKSYLPLNNLGICGKPKPCDEYYTSTFLHGLTWNFTNAFIISCRCAWHNFHECNSISPRVTCPWITWAFVPNPNLVAQTFFYISSWIDIEFYIWVYNEWYLCVTLFSCICFNFTEGYLPLDNLGICGEVPVRGY